MSNEEFGESHRRVLSDFQPRFEDTNLSMADNPTDTVREAVREYVGDGEGIDETILRKYDDAVKADVLRDVANELRGLEFGPYTNESGYQADGWGNPSESIDSTYADWIDEKAQEFEGE